MAPRAAGGRRVAGERRPASATRNSTRAGGGRGRRVGRGRRGRRGRGSTLKWAGSVPDSRSLSRSAWRRRAVRKGTVASSSGALCALPRRPYERARSRSRMGAASRRTTRWTASTGQSSAAIFAAAQRAATPDAVLREHVAAAERLESARGRRRGAERLRRACAARARRRASAHRQPASRKRKREVDVLPVGEERLVEAAELLERGQPVGGCAAARADRVAAPRRARPPAGSTGSPTTRGSCRARSRPSRSAPGAPPAGGRPRPCRPAGLRTARAALDEVGRAHGVVVDEHDHVGVGGRRQRRDSPRVRSRGSRRSGRR